MTKKLMAAGLVAAVAALVFGLSGCGGILGCQRPLSDEEIGRLINEAGDNGRATNGRMDSDLVGSWQTDCLVPDLGSPWAEEHFFTINADGTAHHQRLSYDDHACTAQNMDLEEDYRFAIPAPGEINLTKVGESGTMYDIYRVAGNTLVFGHGFRNNLPYGDATLGDSANRRINTLNEYLVYKRQ